MNPLPSVESVCSMIQQEELQRQVLEDVQLQVESSVMMSKNAEARCTVCGVKGHFKEKCWKVIGYPKWHPRGKKNSQRKGGTNKQGQLNTSFGGRTSRSGFKVSNQAEVAEQPVPGLTSQQIEQLLKLLPASSTSSSVSHSEETDEDIDYSYAGIAAYFHAKKEPIDCVIDTGATDHMTSLSEYLHEIKHRNAKSSLSCLMEFKYQLHSMAMCICVMVWS